MLYVLNIHGFENIYNKYLIQYYILNNEIY